MTLHVISVSVNNSDRHWLRATQISRTCRAKWDKWTYKCSCLVFFCFVCSLLVNVNGLSSARGNTGNRNDSCKIITTVLWLWQTILCSCRTRHSVQEAGWKKTETFSETAMIYFRTKKQLPVGKYTPDQLVPYSIAYSEVKSGDCKTYSSSQTTETSWSSQIKLTFLLFGVLSWTEHFLVSSHYSLIWEKLLIKPLL